MPMMKKEDYGGEDKNNTWCKYCSNFDGSHKTYEEVLLRMSHFMFSKEGQEMSEIKFKTLGEAREAAKEYLSKMPAWKDKSKFD